MLTNDADPQPGTPQLPLILGGAVCAFVLLLVAAQVWATNLIGWATGAPHQPLSVVQWGLLWLTPDPAVVTGQAVSPIMHWTVVALIVLVCCAVAVGIVSLATRLRRDRPNKPGMATAAQIRREMGPKAMKSKAAVLRPSLEDPQPADVGYRVGRALGVDVYRTYRESCIVLGAAGSGKGIRFVIPQIVEAPGSVVTSSTRPDNLESTIKLREQQHHSRAVIFDPSNLIDPAVYGDHFLRFDLIAGCQNPRIALERTKRFTAKVFGEGTSNGGFWQDVGERIVRALLHAAALGGEDIDTVLSWINSRAAAAQAVNLIRDDPRGDKLLASGLSEFVNASSDQAENQWSSAIAVMSWITDEETRRWVRPDAAHPAVDLEQFLREKGTMYLLSPSHAATDVGPLVSGLIDEISETASRLAGRQQGGRLDPPLNFVFDEAANFHIEALPSLISEGGGKGQPTMAVFQSMRQMENGYQNGMGATMWGSASLRIALGAQFEAETARDLSTIIGTRKVERASTSVGRVLADMNTSYSIDREPIMDEGEFSKLKMGQAVILHAGLAPFVVTAPPYWKRW
ncbi:MAG: type IV secretory system conjugative DNA transfer family protein [Pseudoclavibacter sp.]